MADAFDAAWGIVKDDPEMKDSPCDICGEMKLKNHEDSMGDVCLDCYWKMPKDKRRAL
tara:strand:- start:9 stop:182 length:174 start_codon:yes stop_codon:yes gene_type:complete